jgi:hypothetical protein
MEQHGKDPIETSKIFFLFLNFNGKRLLKSFHEIITEQETAFVQLDIVILVFQVLYAK